VKILVCGGRDNDDWRYVWNTLEYYHGREMGFTHSNRITAIVEGGAPGVDEAARWWGRVEASIPVHTYKADWAKDGRAAGPLRNQRMLEEHPDIRYVLAFRGGRGTADMIWRARAAGISVLEVQ
jgi:hypothetical protein